MMGLPDGPKSFRIGLVVLIQYRLWWTASHPASQVAVAITLHAKASSLKMMMLKVLKIVESHISSGKLFHALGATQLRIVCHIQWLYHFYYVFYS